MNSKFIKTLKQVGFNSNAFPDAVKQLENGSNIMQRDLSKHALANSEILKQYVISELSQIKEEQKRIESWHKSLVKKDKSLKAIKLLENRNELHYFAEILNIIDSVTDDLNKHLVTYYPDMFRVETIKPEKELTVPQIALIHVYETEAKNKGFNITLTNSSEIAAKYGYTSKTSGEGLRQDYEFYLSTTNRTARPIPCTPKKLKNKISLFESIVKHLTDKAKQRAIDEINILKTIYENEYQ